jgi:hypothetical protein
MHYKPANFAHVIAQLAATLYNYYKTIKKIKGDMMYQFKVSMLDIFVEKDGDQNSPGEVNFVLYIAGHEIARSNWAWPIYDGGRRAYGADVFFNSESTDIAVRFDVHEDDDWPEKDDYATTQITIDVLKNAGRNAWKLKAISQNKKLICTLSFVLEVESKLPVPQTITAYEHVDARGQSADLLSERFAQTISMLPQTIKLYKIDCRQLIIGNDQISSIYVPQGDYQITLFEHAPEDPNFINGQRHTLPFKGPYLINLTQLTFANQLNWNDRVSYIEIKETLSKIGKVIIK